MDINFKTILSSRVGRRSFLLFLISSLLPIGILAAISLYQVQEQLLEQANKSFHREAKALGMNIISKIQLLDSEIALLTNVETDNKKILNRLKLNLRHLSYTKFNNMPPFVNRQLIDNKITIKKLKDNNREHIKIYETWDKSYLPHILILKLIRDKEGLEHLFFAEVKEKYLWNFDDLGDDETICVLNDNSKVLFCSKAIGPEMIAATKDNMNQQIKDSFEWESGNTTYLGKIWHIFFSYISSNMKWKVVIAKPKSAIMKPIYIFEKILLIITSLTMFLIFLISLRYIKNILSPLLALKNSAEDIARNNYSADVNIDTNDEFEDLSNSFNYMRRELDRKFIDLQYISELDGVVLKSERAENTLYEAMSIIKKAINVEAICIVMLDSSLYYNNIFMITDADDNLIESCLELSETEKEIYKNKNEGYIVELEYSGTMVGKYLLEKNFQFAEIFTNFVNGEISSLFIIPSKKNDLPDSSEDDNANKWVDKISVVLSQISWINKINYQANHDVLTGLPNRQSLQKYLDEEIAFCNQQNSHLAIIFVDLDRFKYINDSLGHVVGDMFLKMISSRMIKLSCEHTRFYRFGGDEFVIVVSRVSNIGEIREDTKKLSKELINLIAEPIFINGIELFSNSSVGASIFPSDGSSLNELLKKSDIAMYKAKKMGGNSYQLYSETMQLDIENRLDLETRLRKAVKENELTAYFQPQCNCNNGDYIGAEALARWNNKEIGMISPNDFIPIAEESNLICDIDLLVLKKTLSCISEWRDKNLDFGLISVNFSPRLIQKENIVSIVLNLISEYNVEPRDIMIEITESAFIDKFEKTINNMNALVKLGIAFVIDDFGTGYSSLSYLKLMPVKKLKIDRAFISSFLSSSKDRAIVKNTIALCKDFNIITLAEGVETTDDLSLLQKLHCDEFQGFLKSKPVSIKNFEKMLSQR